MSSLSVCLLDSCLEERWKGESSEKTPASRSEEVGWDALLTVAEVARLNA